MMDFSIIIPAKNEEINIARCLDSLNNIDYDRERYEVLVVDNGSTDRTVEIATEKGANVFIQPDLTIAGLRNFGAAQARGKILAFLDADCTVLKDWLNEASKYLDERSVACFGSPPIVPENATWVQKTWFNIRRRNAIAGEVDWLESMNMFIPRKAFAAVTGFNERLETCEDYDVSIRLKKHGQVLVDQRILAVHHGEAKDIVRFFRKEHWRAKSNRERLLGGHFDLRELPSLGLPLAYCLLAFVFFTFFLGFAVFGGGKMAVSWLVLLAVWQVPLVVLVFWKIRGRFDFVTGFQLYVLLNVYFFARGLAYFRWK